MTFFKVQRYFNQYVIRENSNRVKLMRFHFRNQFDFFLQTRIRRSIQVYRYYKQVYQEQALRDFLLKLRKTIIQPNRTFLFSAVGGIFTFNWEVERINYDQSVKECFNEFEKIDCLKAKTVFENKSQNNINKNENIQRIRDKCGEEDAYYSFDDELDAWEIYIEKSNMTTWRREEEDGCFSYKVHVTYPDVTAEDFLFVQTDVNYRKEWDNTAVALDVIESDVAQGSNSQVMYWEMLWPKLFANRDYVYIRKCFIDRKRNLIAIVNKSTKHPKCPNKQGLQRVKEYWSYMVIKPKTTFKEPGLEFILTYYDNPGIKIPKAVTSWVAQRQMPEFIDQLYHATLTYAERKASDFKNCKEWGRNQDPGFEYPSDVRLDDFADQCQDTEEEMQDNVNHFSSFRQSKIQNTGTEIKEIANDVPHDQLPFDDVDSKKKTSWWDWWNPYSYFY